MTKGEALKKVEAAAAKHEKKWGSDSAEIEKLENAIVLAARFPPDFWEELQGLAGWLAWHHPIRFLDRKRYGLPKPHDVRPDGKGWVVRYGIKFA